MVSTPIIAIVGPTASGKSALAMSVAQELGGEIICADSRTIYRGMDIGTAKPTVQDQSFISHHLLDLIDPGEAYSAAQFKVDAETIIEAISARNRLPIIVGGTGLYVNALLYGYQFPAGARNDLRATYEALPLEELIVKLQREDPEMASQIDLKNPRRVIRALETVGQPKHKAVALKPEYLLIGLRPDELQLNQQITQRTSAMFQMGLIEEVQELVQRFGSDCEAFRSPGYAEIIDFIAGRVSRSKAEELINLHTRQLVRRQLTWFKRNADIRWFETQDEARKAIITFTQKPL